jgi:hypothetical protein
VVESRELGPDPGDRALLNWAAQKNRILVTIDTDFGELIYLENLSRRSRPLTGCTRARTPVDSPGFNNAL